MGELKRGTSGAESAQKPRLRLFPMASGIKRRWLVNNISVVAAMILLLLVTVGVATTSYYYNSVRASLASRTSTARQINRYMSSSYDQFYSYADQLVQDFSDRDKMEMQIIDTYGRIMFSSTGLTAGSIPGTDDVDDCLATQDTAYFIGYDMLTQERVMAVTAPVFYRNGQIIGMVRFVTSLKLLDRQLRNVWLLLAGFGVLLIGLVVISNQFFIRSIVNPVLKINELARKITGGQYGARLDVEFNDEIGELCTTLNGMSAELARMEKLKNDFISSVSHELRTPLTNIRGYTETLIDAHGDIDEETEVRFLGVIHNEADRMTHIVKDLLTLSQLDYERMQMNSGEVSLCAIARSAAEAMAMEASRQQVTLTCELPEDLPPVLGDRERIEQVVVNIISNAVKYNRPEGSVTLTGGVEGGKVFVRVKDTGIGVPEEDLPRVFERFYRVDKARSRERGGTGLGLAIAKEIIEYHGGNITFESVYGEGSVVTIALPAAESEGGKHA